MILLFLISLFIINLHGNDKNIFEMIREKRAILKDMPYRWSFPIEYKVTSGFGEFNIDNALRKLEEETCVRFKKVDRFSKSGIEFVASNGCLSFVGKISEFRPQELRISNGCVSINTIIHEVLHALGLLHEMGRYDVDNYIKVNEDNIIWDKRDAFKKYDKSEADSLGLRYDFGSLMHYKKFQFSRNGKPTIEANNKLYSMTMGQNKEIGFNDLKLVNLFYCKDKCKKKIGCKNWGYEDPNNCNQCKCPRLYTGKYCEGMEVSSKGCGQSELTAINEEQFIYVDDAKNCYYEIRAPGKSKIELKIIKTNLYKPEVCYPGSGMEVKYLKDKSVTGAMLCGKNENVVIKSNSNTIRIHYTGLMSHHYVNFSYKIL